MAGNIDRFFDVVYVKGLGKAYRCKICYAKHKHEFLVVSEEDALRHLKYHEVLKLEQKRE